MKGRGWIAAAAAVLVAVPAWGQTQNGSTEQPVSTLRVTTRAVLVDVVVTDRQGNPVKGLTKDDFKVLEEGKPQAVSYFEENRANPYATPVKALDLPPNVFCNYSPLPTPPAVNVLLLDSLNTPMEDQTYVHQQALHFLKSVHPGTRMAVFTMSLGLHFVQGFTDDPTLLLAGLNDGNNNEIEVPALVKSYDESGAQSTIISIMSRPVPAGPNATTTAASPAMIAALTDFFQTTDTAQETDRAYRTLENLQRLARFLSAFPGRKNLIWFSETFPVRLFGDSSQRLDDQIRKTVNMLTAARVAVYPVDARGAKEYHYYEAGNDTHTIVNSSSEVMGAQSVQANSIINENGQRDSDQETMSMLAEDSGGKVFKNTNGLGNVIADISQTSDDFYSLSYAPTDSRMNGRFRHIVVKVAGGKYHLSYRRGYYASDAGLPGAVEQEQAAARDHSSPHGDGKQGATDPLGPFMDLGMPQSEQILYKLLVVPEKTGPDTASDKKKDKNNKYYALDFAVDLRDLHLKAAADGAHEGTLYVEFLVYDRYGGVVRHEEHLVKVHVPQKTFETFEKTGVQMQAHLQVPRSGHYWLRTGVYDADTNRVGTMEIPLDQVTLNEMASK
ncbi:MAG TPA: VWA domain-containing protein [Terracidiphilus sp.]|nr:VWA domain-containing protein [Terracidiphilus sp.]